MGCKIKISIDTLSLQPKLIFFLKLKIILESFLKMGFLNSQVNFNHEK